MIPKRVRCSFRCYTRDDCLIDELFVFFFRWASCNLERHATGDVMCASIDAFIISKLRSETLRCGRYFMLPSSLQMWPAA